MKKTVAKQYHLQLSGRSCIGRYGIITGDPGRVKEIARHLDYPTFVARNREYTTWRGRLLGERVFVISGGIGNPSTAIAVEELARLGVHTLIRVGTAGSLQPKVKLGDLSISLAAVRDEGTTMSYVPAIFPAVANLEVTNALARAAWGMGVSHHVGVTHSKDAFFMEGKEEDPRLGIPLGDQNHAMWEVWRKAGVLSTSMEAASIFVVGGLRQMRTGEVLVNIGLTYEDQPIASQPVSREPCITTAIEALKIVIADDRQTPSHVPTF